MLLLDLFFLLAIFDGINPAIIVSTILIITNIIAPPNGRLAIPDTPAIAFIIAFIGIVRIRVINIPKSPAAKPIINVSALNTLDISFFRCSYCS